MKNDNSVTMFRWVDVLMASFVAVLPFVFSRHLFYGSVNAKYFYVTAFASLLALFFSWLLITGRQKFVLRKRWLLWLFTAVLGAYYVSSFFGVFWGHSLGSDLIRSSGVVFLTYVGLLALVFCELTTERGWTMIRRSIALSSGFLSLLTFLAPEGLGFLLDKRSAFRIAEMSLSNNTFAGAYLVLGLIVTLVEVARSRRGSATRRFFVFWAGVIFMSPLLIRGDLWLGRLPFSALASNPIEVLGAARASGVTALLLFAFLLGVFLLRRVKFLTSKKYLLTAWMGLWVAGVLALVSFLFVPGSLVQGKYIAESTPARLLVWQSGFRAVAERPLLGWGPENFRFGFEKYFDNGLYTAGGEPWFDRAHNVIVDHLVSIGVAGTLLVVIASGYFLYVVTLARRKELIGGNEAILLGSLVFAHFLQLQTSFDTVSTYALIGVISGYGLWLEKEMVKKGDFDNGYSGKEQENSIQKWLGALLMFLVIVGSFYAVFNEYGRQRSFYRVFASSASADDQIKDIKRGLERTADFESLRLGSSSLIKGTLTTMAGNDLRQETVPDILEQAGLYEELYLAYLKQMPSDYRARMNYSNLLMFETFLGKNRLSDARRIIEGSYSLTSPNSLTYIMDALAFLYEGKIPAAKDMIDKSLALNPGSQLAIKVKEHILKQEKQFPNISILRLENL